MGVVRIDDDLQVKVEKWLKNNGNKYQHPSLTSFINSAVYEKLKRMDDGKKES
jgi:hypothetical protein|tara:strand:- start:1518 stop:1676 length:159 start_codon:yes stop_codon:yes gene_type:complete